jgi:hypothetical protein
VYCVNKVAAPEPLVEFMMNIGLLAFKCWIRMRQELLRAVSTGPSLLLALCIAWTQPAISAQWHPERNVEIIVGFQCG